MITVLTDHPIAVDSPDHLTPVGTRNDNSRNPEFNRKLYDLIPACDVRLLDIGCAGGGLVKSILDDGGLAVGIEGSDYSKARLRAEWATIPGNLFTADATKPFSVGEIRLYDRGMQLWDHLFFNVVTAWEFWEHIAEPDIPAAAENILHHITPDGFFVGSINDQPDVQDGVVTDLHQTVRPREWWLARFAMLGFEHAPDIEEHFRGGLVREGPGSFPVALRPSSSRS